MMLTGRTLSASAARGIGLVDKVVAPAVVLDTAVALALSGTTRPFKQRATAWATNTWLARTCWRRRWSSRSRARRRRTSIRRRMR